MKALFLTLAVCASASWTASSAEEPDRDPSTPFVSFNVATGETSGPNRFQNGDSVEVVLTEVNFFREAYRIRVHSVDRVLEVPGPLKNLIVVDASKAELALPDGPTLPESTVEVVVAEGSFSKEINAVRSAFARLRALEFQSARGQEPSRDLLEILTKQANHESGRTETRRFLATFVGSDTTTVTIGRVPNLAGDLRQEVEKATQSWQTAVDRWAFAYAIADTIDKATKRHNELVNEWDEQAQGLEAQLDGRVQGLLDLEALARLALDRSRTPDTLRTVFVARGDGITVDVEITPHGQTPKDLDLGTTWEQPTRLRFETPVRGRLTVGFTGGLAVTGFTEQHWALEQGSDSLVVVETVGDAHGPVAASLLTLLYTLPRSVALGPSMGITIESKPKYLAGFTIQYGRSVRVALSGGWAWGKTAQLDGESLGAPPNRTPLKTRDVVRRRGFASLTIAVSRVPWIGGSQSNKQN